MLRTLEWCRSRSSVYYRPVPACERRWRMIEAIDRIHTDKPFLGSRRIVDELEARELRANRKCVQRLMRLMGIEAIYRRPCTSRPGTGGRHRVFPYRLAGVAITKPNQVWAADVTFIPMAAGFAYLVAIMDVHSRKILSWRLSNTQAARFCVEALQEALALYGTPEVFNSDQGSQFTSREFTSILEAKGVTISMDGRGRWIDNVFIERFWRSLKYEEVYLHAYDDLKQAFTGIARYMLYYNGDRKHASLGRTTPDSVYAGTATGHIRPARHPRSAAALTPRACS